MKSLLWQVGQRKLMFQSLPMMMKSQKKMVRMLRWVYSSLMKLQKRILSLELELALWRPRHQN